MLLDPVIHRLSEAVHPLANTIEAGKDPGKLALRRSARLPVIVLLHRLLKVPVLLLTDRADHALAMGEELELWAPDVPRLVFPEPTPLFYENAAWGESTRRERLLAFSLLASSLHVGLVQAVSSGERMDYTIQKAVELGVTAIQPVTSNRSVVRLDAERGAKRVAHWQAVAIAACEQCGRNRVPGVRPVVSFTSWLGEWAADRAQGLLLSPRATHRLADLKRPQLPVTLLAGPEGGLAPEEQQAAERAGFMPVRLGPPRVAH